MLDTIMTFDNNAIFICMKKVIVKENVPNSVHKLSMTVSENTLLLGISPSVNQANYVLHGI
jgi:hypothetical protein